jgi:hypothetical protein
MIVNVLGPQTTNCVNVPHKLSKNVHVPPNDKNTLHKIKKIYIYILKYIYIYIYIVFKKTN